MELLQAIGGISGIIAFLGFLWTIFFQMAKYKVRTDTLWEIYIIEALKSRLVEHSSPYRPREGSEALIPDDIKSAISKVVSKGHKKSLGQLSGDVVAKVGVAKIQMLASQNEASVQDIIALLTAFADKERNRGRTK